MRKANYSDLQLTHRELQILQLIAHGYSAKEVAQQISIAPRTVEGHIDTIRLKLQARNRAHMVAKAMAAQLVAMDNQPMITSIPPKKALESDLSEFPEVGQPLLQLVSGPPVTDPGKLACARPG